uniref:Ion_trans domain-containing protein n=1 Tax=Macrostomum lignano TaxID=282301 RepID=A0A1I8FCY9_9PLAT
MRQFDIIPLGLYAVKVLRSLCRLSVITTGVREGLEERADSMEQLLKAALQEVFINDRSQRKTVTCDFIRLKLTPFGNHSVVSLAAAAKCGNFLSLACCQDALDKDWFGCYFESVGLTGCAACRGGSAAAAECRHLLRCDQAQATTLEQRWRLSHQPGIQRNCGEQPHQPMRKRCRAMQKDGVLISDGMSEERRQKTGISRSNWMSKETSNSTTNPKPEPMLPTNTTCCHTLVLLALLTSTVLFHFHSRLNRLETLIAVWFVGLVVEEAIECRNCKSPLIYLGDMWNVMDLASIGLFYLGFFAKLGLDLTTGAEVERMSCVPDFVDSRYYWIRVLYCVCLFLLYCRLLFYAVIFKAIGPKIRMICEMLVTDLLPFLLVLGIFMAAFGVSLQSLLYPNGYYQRSSRWEMQRVWVNLIEKAFYITVGEFFVEELKGLACEEAGCPHEIGRVLVPTALNFLFILVTNVLLLNLLIALFSKTVDQIHGNSTSV